MRSTAEQRGWYVYDWAISGFSTSVVVVFAGPYITGVAEGAAGADGLVRPLGVPVSVGAYYPYLVSAAALLQVVAMPLVAAVADRTGRRRALLAASTFTGAGATALLALSPADAYLAVGALFLLATVAAGCALVVANAWLPDIAEPERRDTVSSRGWALGYLGGGVLLAGHLALTLLAETDAIALEVGDAVRIAIISTALWWAAFTLVPLARLDDRPPAAVTRGPDASPWRSTAGFRQLAASLRLLRGARATLVFLLAFFLYNDGVQTVISQSAVFGTVELGLGQGTIAGAVLLVQFVAVGGTIGFGVAAERVGAKRVVLASLVVWLVIVAIGYVLPEGQPLAFFGLAGLIGVVLGGTQALSRSLFSQMVPAGREAEYFSIYEISDRALSWIGPLMFGLAVQFTGSYRIAITSLGVLFGLGMLMLWRTDVAAAVAEGRRASASGPGDEAHDTGR